MRTEDEHTGIEVAPTFVAVERGCTSCARTFPAVVARVDRMMVHVNSIERDGFQLAGFGPVTDETRGETAEVAQLVPCPACGRRGSLRDLVVPRFLFLGLGILVFTFVGMPFVGTEPAGLLHVSAIFGSAFATLLTWSGFAKLRDARHRVKFLSSDGPQHPYRAAAALVGGNP